MAVQLRIDAYDRMMMDALADACEATGALLKYGEKPSYDPDVRLTMGVNWIAGDLADMRWTIVMWRMPHWSEGRDLEMVTIKHAADHVPGGVPTMRPEGRRGLERFCAVVASLQAMDVAIRDAGQSTDRPPSWAFGMNKAAVLLARHGGFDLGSLGSTQGSGTYRNPTGGTLRDMEGAGVLKVWTRRFIVHVHELKPLEGRPIIFRSYHARRRNVLSIPKQAIPDTVLNAMAGLDIADAAGHPAWPAPTGVRVTSAQMGQEGTEPGALILALSATHEGLDDAPSGVKPWWKGKPG